MDRNIKGNSTEKLKKERVFVNMLMKTFVMEIGRIIRLKDLLTIVFKMEKGMNNDYVKNINKNN